MVEQEQRDTARVARDAAIAKVLPGADVRPIAWTGGRTEALVTGDGPAILFLHGGAGEAGHWLPLMARLRRRYRVIAVDAPGHGLADPHSFHEDLYGLGARFIGDVLDALHIERAVIAGNSMGGVYATGFAQAAPDRVERLVLIGAPAGTTRRVPLPLKLMRWSLTRPLAKKIMRGREPSRVRARLGRLLVAHPERLDDSLVRSFAETTARNVDSIVRFVIRAVDARGRSNDELMFAPHWRAARVPTIFIWGEDDRADSPDAGRRLAVSRGAAFVEIAAAGHQPALDDPDAVATALVSALESPAPTALMEDEPQ